MLIAGSQADGVALLERAADAAGSVDQLEPASVLALGNGYFALARYQEAADAYGVYIAAVGEPSAGNAPSLLESAIARAAGLPDPHQSAEQVSGQLVFAANCAVCHGQAAQGGSGPALAGSPRAANVANVRDAVAFGRGLMPGFTAQLSEPELEAVVTYVTQVLASAP
jgi:mono/diheme cytochrome c family protein